MANFYPKNISERFRAPKNVGSVSDVNAAGTSATLICGAALRLTLRLDTKTKEILEAKFKTNGCGYLIASADVLVEKTVGRRLTELHGLDKNVLRAEIETQLGKFPENRQHCLDLVFETLQNAFADYRARQVKEFAGEKALVCACFGVSEETIENLVERNSLATVEEVTDACKAGGGCGSCQPLIEDILDVYWREQ